MFRSDKPMTADAARFVEVIGGPGTVIESVSQVEDALVYALLSLDSARSASSIEGRE